MTTLPTRSSHLAQIVNAQRAKAPGAPSEAPGAGAPVSALAARGPRCWRSGLRARRASEADLEAFEERAIGAIAAEQAAPHLTTTYHLPSPTGEPS